MVWVGGALDMNSWPRESEWAAIIFFRGGDVSEAETPPSLCVISSGERRCGETVTTMR